MASDEHSSSYCSYDALAASERYGVDYRIEHRVGDPSVLVLAIHAGGIERHTGLVAERIALDDLSLYMLVGMKPTGNRIHHVPSERFREAKAQEMLERAMIVVSIHGEANREQEYVMPGGRDFALRDRIGSRLAGAGIPIRTASAGLGGTSPENICNCGASRAGVQLEISRALRNVLSRDSHLIESFAGAVRAVLGRAG